MESHKTRIDLPSLANGIQLAWHFIQYRDKTIYLMEWIDPFLQFLQNNPHHHVLQHGLTALKNLAAAMPEINPLQNGSIPPFLPLSIASNGEADEPCQSYPMVVKRQIIEKGQCGKH